MELRRIKLRDIRCFSQIVGLQATFQNTTENVEPYETRGSRGISYTTILQDVLPGIQNFDTIYS